MKKASTISEIAEFFNVSAQTLRYYDRIGLLKPEVVAPGSGYRLYRQDSFDRLYLIRELKQLGLSLEQIKSYCETRDIRGLEITLNHTLSGLNEEIRQLEAVRKHTEDYLRSIRLLESAHGQSVFEFRPIRERYGYVLDINFPPEMLRSCIYMMQESFSHSPARTAEPGRVVLGVRQAALEAGEINVYHCIGHLLKQPVSDRSVRTFPEGTYAVACHLGSYDHIFSTYRKLLRFIQENGYSVCGDSLEISVVDTAFTENPEEFVTEIQIPVCPIP